jgi:hypothetical protein
MPEQLVPPVEPRHGINLKSAIAHLKSSGAWRLPAGASAALADRFEKRFPVRILLEDGFAAVAAVHHMIDGTLMLGAKLASHAGSGGIEAFCVNSEKTSSKNWASWAGRAQAADRPTPAGGDGGDVAMDCGGIAPGNADEWGKPALH